MRNYIIKRISKRVENICSAEKIERLMKTQCGHYKRKFGIKIFRVNLEFSCLKH